MRSSTPTPSEPAREGVRTPRDAVSAPGAATLACLQCGAPVAKKRPAKFCAAACKAKHHRERTEERRRAELDAAVEAACARPKRTATRRDLDGYFTPPLLAEALVERLQEDGWWHGGRVLEPSAGEGAFVKAAESILDPKPLNVTPVEVDEQRARALGAVHKEFTTYSNGVWGAFNLVIGNPPYNQAEQHVRCALRCRADFGVVAFLLRMGFLESEERAAFWKDHPASKVYVLSQRPSFTGNGKTDRGQSYGLFVWATWHRGPTELETLSWREPVRRLRSALAADDEKDHA